jgi:enoyl-[acyl-carrier protein] reductase III
MGAGLQAATAKAPPQESRLGHAWAIILGVSSGFGAASAKVFAANGYAIFGIHMDRRAGQQRVDALRSELESHGVPVVFRNENAASDEARSAALEDLSQRLEPEDHVAVLLHSLAFGTLTHMVGPKAVKRKQLEMTLDVMAHSLIYWTRDLIAREQLGSGARIFAMTSAGSSRALPSYGPVSAAKASLEAHVRQLAVELAPSGITVNAILAGVTLTPALEKIPGADALVEQARSRNPHGRLTSPEDVAECLVALCHPGTAWMTGNVLHVDGGENITG